MPRFMLGFLASILGCNCGCKPKISRQVRTFSLFFWYSHLWNECGWCSPTKVVKYVWQWQISKWDKNRLFFDVKHCVSSLCLHVETVSCLRTRLAANVAPVRSWWPSGWDYKNWFPLWRLRWGLAVAGTVSARRLNKAARYTSVWEKKKKKDDILDFKTVKIHFIPGIKKQPKGRHCDHLKREFNERVLLQKQCHCMLTSGVLTCEVLHIYVLSKPKTWQLRIRLSFTGDNIHMFRSSKNIYMR